MSLKSVALRFPNFLLFFYTFVFFVLSDLDAGNASFFTVQSPVESIFTTTIVNTNNFYDTASGNTICPTTGVYEFSLYLHSLPEAVMEARLTVGTHAVKIKTRGSDTRAGSTSMIVRFHAGESVELTLDASQQNDYSSYSAQLLFADESKDD